MNANKNKTPSRSGSATKPMKKINNSKNISTKKKPVKTNDLQVENTILKTKKRSEESKSLSKRTTLDKVSLSKEKIVRKKIEDKKEDKLISPSEVKITKNVDTISRLINNSNDILAQQSSLLEKCEELTKKVTSSDYEVERQLGKNENDDFPHFLDKYSSKLGTVLSKIRSHTEEVEEIKCKGNLF
jgi:hypothetical protein